MIITIQGKTFNPLLIKRITTEASMNCMFDGEVDIMARIHFGFFDTLDFPGYDAQKLQKEINKKMKYKGN